MKTAHHRKVEFTGLSRAQIVAALAEEPGQSRKELADRLHVGRATVTAQVRRLMELGIVRELPSRAEGAGRPSVPLELVSNAALSLGVSIEPGRLVLLAVGADGTTVAEGQVPFVSEDPDPGHRVASLIRDWGRSLPEPRQDPAIGVALSGVVDESDGHVQVSVVLGWRDLALRAELAESLGVTVWVTNDMRALATRAALHPPEELGSDFLALSLRSGVGMAIVLDGSVRLGHDDASTEFGHVSVDPAGPPCGCGNRGCVQQYVGEREMAEALQHLSGRRVTSWSEASILAAESTAVAQHLQACGHAFGRAAGGAATLTGIPHFLITGEGLEAWAYLQEGFAAGLAETTPTLLRRPNVALQTWNDFSIARGAATLALSRTVTRSSLREGSRALTSRAGTRPARADDEPKPAAGRSSPPGADG